MGIQNRKASFALCPSDLFLSLYFQNSKWNVATV